MSSSNMYMILLSNVDLPFAEMSCLAMVNGHGKMSSVVFVFSFHISGYATVSIKLVLKKRIQNRLQEM